MFKRMFSALFVIILVFSIFSILPYSVTAQEADVADEGANLELASTGNPYGKWQDTEYPDGDGYYEIRCTWFAWQKAYDVCGVELPAWGNGNSWYASAQAANIPTGTVPRVNSIACFNSGYYGHVSFVTEVHNDNTMTVVEGGRTDLDHTASQGVGTSRPSSVVGQGGLQGFIYLDGGSNYPTSNLETVTGGVGTITVAGWSFDRDNVDEAVELHVYIGGPAGTEGAEAVLVVANRSRKDVDNAFHVGEYHGFEKIIPTKKIGSVQVYVYAINIGGGPNLEIGHKTVNITKDTSAPVIEVAYNSLITPNSFRVCVVPKDNVEITKVRIATWTQSDQSDLIWHDASYNGSDTYYVDLNRADYSSTKNSYYYNHIYVYDLAGNSSFAASDVDYRIKSDTGKSIPEGDYRILSSLDTTKGLDVQYGSTASGANIWLYTNSNEPKQTFSLDYVDNGFYTIKNNNSNCVLDVAGDTYVICTNVIQHVSNGGANQQWMIKPTGDGYYYIVARSNGLALDVSGGQAKDGTNIQVYTQNQSNAQKWKLRRVLKDSMVTVVASTQSGSATVTSTITVTVDGKILTEGKDYNKTTPYNSTTRAFTVIIEGIGDYCDIITKTVTATVIEPTQPPTDPPTEPSIIKLGDVDGDGEVTIIDATCIQRKLANFPTEKFVESAADADEDKKITILDATQIQKHLASMPSNKNIGKPIA